MKKFLKIVIPASALATPFAAFAISTLTNVIDKFAEIINGLLPIVVAIALLAFFWGLVQYIFYQNSEEKKKTSKNIMIWGLVALFVMVSVWGIINVVQETFDIQPGGSITPPSVDTNI